MRKFFFLSFFFLVICLLPLSISTITPWSTSSDVTCDYPEAFFDSRLIDHGDAVRTNDASAFGGKKDRNIHSKILMSIPKLLKTAAVIEPKAAHKFTMIFMHGLGDCGSSFIDVFEHLNFSNLRVILPNAPDRPITCNGGYKMPGWFDIYKLGSQRKPNDKQDDAGVLATADEVMELLDYELTKVKNAEHIFIGGFSQGSAMSLHVGPRYKEQLGGVVALSGYVPISYHGDKYINQKDIPIFMYHGKDDAVVQLDLAHQSRDFLKTQGLQVKYQEEPGLGHSLSNRELSEVKLFLKDRMNAASGN